MKIKTLIILSIAIIGFKPVIAQSIRYPIALPYIGLAAYSTQQSDPLSFTANQAALASIKQAGVGLYGERRFMLQSTSTYAAAIALTTQLGNFGTVVNYSGFQNFNEYKIGLAYAKKLGNKVDVGVQFNQYGYRIPVYDSDGAINFEAGAIIHFSDKLNGGLHVYNPVGGKLKNSEEKLAATYTFGLGYDASESFFVGSEIIKEEDKPVNVVAGFQYRFANQFFVRGGLMAVSTTAFGGAGIAWKNLRLDVSGSYHPQLGFSPGVLLVANFGNKKDAVASVNTNQ